MTKYYIAEKIETICWDLFLIQKDIEKQKEEFTNKDKRRFSEAFSILKNLEFQWSMEAKRK